MAQDINCLTAVGNLTRDAEIISDNKIVKFTIANNSYKDKVTFFDCVMFGERGAKVVDYLTKGKKVCVSGRMESKEYVAKNGEKKISWSILVNDVQLLSNKQTNDDYKQDRQDRHEPSEQKFDYSDIPF